MRIAIYVDNIEELDKFPTTLENKLTNEKMIIEVDLFGEHNAQVKIRRLPLNSTRSFEEMWEMNGDKLSHIYIDMV